MNDAGPGRDLGEPAVQPAVRDDAAAPSTDTPPAALGSDAAAAPAALGSDAAPAPAALGSDRTLEHSDEDRGVPPVRHAPGAALGHFRIVRQLGAGGMGVVFEAHDPILDRRVAIKLVRDSDAGTAAGARLVREAQAMARLSHPNVVPVHGVETVDGQVAIVMELVRGDTLEAWLQQPRSWRDIVAVFRQAGEGLAAAHRAGLVHRDFKPSNVLIDGAGHVRVGDFGLARHEHEDDARPRIAPRVADGSAPTRPVGTPAYMAPEQKAGAVVDARADQYSLAISLQRALAGLPVPRRVTAALARACRADREQRFPLLQDLLEELDRELGRAREARRRATVLASSALAALAAAGALGIWLTRPAPDRCQDGAALVDGLWNPAAREAQARRFLALRADAAASVTSTARVLDDWSAAWRLGRRSACRAEPRHRAAQLSCLDRNLAELRAQLGVWSRADAAVVDLAPSAAAGLPTAAACSSQTVRATSPLAASLQQRIAEVNAGYRAGRAASLKAGLPALLADTAADPTLSALALLAAGTVEKELGELAAARTHLAQAAREAGKAGDDDTLLLALLGESAVATEQGRPQDGLGMLDAADAVAARGHLDRADRIAWTRGGALLEGGRHAEAITELTRAVALVEARAARDPAARVELAAAIARLAAAQSRVGHFAEARDLLQRASELEVQVLGERHPEHAKTLHDLAEYEGQLDNWPRAIELNRRSRELLVAAYGADHRLVIATDISLAGLELWQDHAEAAQRIFTTVLADMARSLPPDDPFFEVVEDSLGSLERNAGRCAAAVPHFRRAVELIEQAGRTGSELGFKLANLGACLADLGQHGEARAVIERSLALLEQDQEPPIARREPMAVLADLEAAAGRRAHAIELATQLIELVQAQQQPDDPDYRKFLEHERQQLARWSR